MALLASTIISNCCNDMRNTLDATANATLVLGWVDRIQKEVLHTTLYNALMKNVTSCVTTAGTSSYTLTPSPAIRRVQLVYDRTFNQELMPTSMIARPAEQGQESQPSSPPNVYTNISEESTRPHAMLNLKTQTLWPQYYRFIGPTTLYLFPAPATSVYTGTVEVYYEGIVPTVASTGATLTIPEDGSDVLTAGVNVLAATFLKRPDEAQMWAATYNSLKQGLATV